jgi:hypothetical protein
MMHLQQFIEETSFYKTPSMLLVTPPAAWQQQIHLPFFQLNIVNFPDEEILQMFSENEKTNTIIISGDEPMDLKSELRSFIFSARKHFPPNQRPRIVIFTKYFMDELTKLPLWGGLYAEILQYGNVVIRFGRPYKKDQKYFNEDLQCTLFRGQDTICFDGHKYE